jgi:hypothetical protein
MGKWQAQGYNPMPLRGVTRDQGRRSCNIEALRQERRMSARFSPGSRIRIMICPERATESAAYPIRFTNPTDTSNGHLFHTEMNES